MRKVCHLSCEKSVTTLVFLLLFRGFVAASAGQEKRTDTLRHHVTHVILFLSLFGLLLGVATTPSEELSEPPGA